MCIDGLSRFRSTGDVADASAECKLQSITTEIQDVAARRGRDNSEPDIYIYVFMRRSSGPAMLLKDRPNRLKDVRWRATPSALLSRGLARGSREADRLPDLKSPRPVPQSRCCSPTGSGGTTDIRSSRLNTQSREHAYPNDCALLPIVSAPSAPR
jgi:hypothetical protein